MAASTLSASNLVKKYGDVVVLDGAGIEVAPGEAVAVTGPSGSGKTTLLYCLSGVVAPDSGEVVLGDRRLEGLSEAARATLRRTDFGFVFQFPGLLPELPVAENVALPLMLNGIPRREAVRRSRALLPALGLGRLADRRPGELSGGQAQRVGVARALVHEPAVVFADEPTGALDTVTGDEVLDLLVSQVRERGAALVVVTHDGRVAGRCDRQVEVVDGLTRPGSARATT